MIIEKKNIIEILQGEHSDTIRLNYFTKETFDVKLAFEKFTKKKHKYDLGKKFIKFLEKEKLIQKMIFPKKINGFKSLYLGGFIFEYEDFDIYVYDKKI